MTELDRPGGAKPAQRRHPRRALSFIAGVILIVAKAHATVDFVAHRTGVVVVLCLLLVSSLLRVRPVAFAVCASALAGLLFGAHSLSFGVPVGAGGFALLMTLFFSVSTVLHVRQRRHVCRRRLDPRRQPPL